MEVSDTFKLPGVTKEALRLKLFLYSLRDRGRAWLNSLPLDLVATWDDLAKRFLKKYFPSTKNAQLRVDITSFKQMKDESLYETWERFKESLRKCPHRRIPNWMQMETFLQWSQLLKSHFNGCFRKWCTHLQVLQRILCNFGAYDDQQ